MSNAEVGETAGYMLVEKSPAGIWHPVDGIKHPTMAGALASLNAYTNESSGHGYAVTIPTGIAKLSLVMIRYPEEP